MSERQITVPPVLENILLEYTINVLVENPEDIISHAADYFTRLRDNRDQENPPGMVGEKTDISNILGSRASRRQSVVGERYDPEQDDDEEEIEKFPKSDEERKRIKERTKDIFLFKVLDEEDINEIIEAMMPREVETGQVIIRQGDDGDFFYVVDKGTFEACVKDGKGEERIVKIYDNSGSFGELALLHNQPRAATVTATTKGLLWAVSRKTFNRLVVKRAFEKRQKYMALLEKVPELQPLTEFEKMQVCDALSPVFLKKGNILFEEGDEGDGMYFVEEGKISIIQKSSKNKSEQEVAQLGPGEYFGEMALVKNQPRAGTAKAVVDTKLAFLEVKAFERLLGPCIDIMKARMEKYKRA
ncbi:cAMP-dependent protein kinase type II regulatory subunit-like isoform X2 [Argiope bruennichi]|uniref:cAMP-dependent protein kinase type II like protein n=2 Tax=Argiope bruennichi TaxID=94029 RepID=A0A8T0F7D1_ARGBR|nr:cAMP-dependent protein kinase type II regulatory subunit-like isoform X2 [Argiope bruennichi]XP_055943321.1 cAMP-dependent protein kinase type II regulatory subunit-like isoform X2 [Argiope bruennichi]XP_055943322.1 cAMP-dependent protein kinase type II regulatory subunit-like isoform X2 [Argiope bruennichi]KAF8786238.1 cAMP-dependent protein kinase type II like protein [Argiope bruennichi]